MNASYAMKLKFGMLFTHKFALSCPWVLSGGKARKIVFAILAKRKGRRHLWTHFFLCYRFLMQIRSILLKNAIQRLNI